MQKVQACNPVARKHFSVATGDGHIRLGGSERFKCTTDYLNSFTHERASRLIANGIINVDPLITQEISLKDVVEVVAKQAPDGEVRAIAVP